MAKDGAKKPGLSWQQITSNLPFYTYTQNQRPNTGAAKKSDGPTHVSSPPIDPKQYAHYQEQFDKLQANLAGWGNAARLEYYPAGKIPTLPQIAPTIMLPPYMANPEDLRNNDTNYINALEADYNEIIKTNPFLAGVLDSLKLLQDKLNGGEQKPEKYAIIDLATGQIYYTNKPPQKTYLDQIYIPANDPLQMHLIEASSSIISELIAEKIDKAVAAKRIRSLQDDIENFNLENISDKVHSQRVAIAEKQEELQKLRREREDFILSTQQLSHHPVVNDVMVPNQYAQKRLENGLISYDKDIAILGEEIKSLQTSFNGVATILVHGQAMLALAEGASEDDILSQAGLTLGELGLRKRAYKHFNNAQLLAKKFGDLYSQQQQEIYKIKYNPNLEVEDRIAAFHKHLKMLEIYRDYGPDASGIDADTGRIVYVNAHMQEKINHFKHTSLKTQIIAEVVRLASINADADPGDADFVKSVALLDKAIEDATGDAETYAQQIAHFASAATIATLPYTKKAAEVIKQAQVETRNTLTSQIVKRAERVEKLYAHHIKSNPEDINDSALSNSLASLGAQSYFYASKETGFPYSALTMTLGHYAKTYPASEIKDELLATLRKEASHLVGKDGKLLPLHIHRPAWDGEIAKDEIAGLQWTPGTFVEQFGMDMTSSTAVAWGSAKACGGIGTLVGTPAAGAVAGTVCGAGGFVGGVFAGQAITRQLYSNEINLLQHEARMAGMKLSGLKRGEGDKNIAHSVALLGLSALFAPIGGRVSVQFGDKVLTILKPTSIRYIGGQFVREGTKAIRWAPALYTGVRGFVGLNGKGVDNLSMLSAAERITEALGPGSRTTADQLSEITALIRADIRDSLSRRLHRAIGISKISGQTPASAPIPMVENLIDLLLPTDPSTASARIMSFRKLLHQVSRGKIGRKKFTTDLNSILGTTDNLTVEQLSTHFFSQKGVERATYFGDAIDTAIPRSADSLVEKIAVIAGRSDSVKFLTRLIRGIGTTNSLQLLDLLHLFDLHGLRKLKIEQLLKALVRDADRGKKLLAAMLVEPTNEAVIESGQAYTKHSLMGLIAENSRASLHTHIRDGLMQQASIRQLANEDFFTAIQKIEGMAQFLERILPEGANLGLRPGRWAALEAITEDSSLCREFIERVMGTKLVHPYHGQAPSAAQNKLLDVILLRNSAEPEAFRLRKEIQWAMKDFLRPKLVEWNNTPLYRVADVTARSKRREAKRALAQAFELMEDEEGFVTAVAGQLAPWNLDAFSPYITEAVSSYRRETQQTLLTMILGSMKHTSKRGVLDAPARIVNRAMDTLLYPLDRIWTKRMGVATRSVIVADSDMSVTTGTLLRNKMILRHAHVAKVGTKNGTAVAAASLNDVELGPVLKRIERAHQFIGQRFGTEELRRAHRICLPVAATDWAVGQINGKGMNELGVICAMIGGNYYMEKVGIANTYGLDIAMTARTLSTAISKVDTDSDDWLDIQRTGGTYSEVVFAMALQSFAMYGLNFAQKTGFGEVFGNLPFVRRMPLAMNGKPFFRFYRGSAAKPDFLTGGGFWGGMAGLGFATGASTMQSFAIASITKGKQFMNASGDYPLWRASNYAVNGPLVNVPGFLVNRHLERNNPNADLRSTMRQLFERVLGIGTQYLTLQLTDAYAGKGDYFEKENRLLDEAAAKMPNTRGKAWDLFARRYSYDLIGWWYRLLPEERTFRLHSGPSFNLTQMKSWYSTEKMKMSNNRISKGYFVELTNNKARLDEFLRDVSVVMSDPKATWRTDFFDYKRTAHSKALYYFSLMAKHYTLLTKSDVTEEESKRFKPFADFVSSSPYKKYWSLIPKCNSEAEIKEAIIRLEDKNEILINQDGKTMSLEDLLAFLRTESHGTLDIPHSSTQTTGELKNK